MLILGGLLVVIPVISAKSIYYKKFTFIQSNGAFNFYLGNHKNASGTCELRPGLAWRKTHLEAEKVAKEKNISLIIILILIVCFISSFVVVYFSYTNDVENYDVFVEDFEA